MQIHLAAAAAVAATLFLNPQARASEDAPRPRAYPTPAACAEAPGDPLRPESELRRVVESFLGYRVMHVGVDGGCYAVLASDRSGTPFEVRFRGSDLRMVSRYVVKDAR